MWTTHSWRRHRQSVSRTVWFRRSSSHWQYMCTSHCHSCSVWSLPAGVCSTPKFIVFNKGSCTACRVVHEPWISWKFVHEPWISWKFVHEPWISWKFVHESWMAWKVVHDLGWSVESSSLSKLVFMKFIFYLSKKKHLGSTPERPVSWQERLFIV